MRSLGSYLLTLNDNVHKLHLSAFGGTNKAHVCMRSSAWKLKPSPVNKAFIKLKTSPLPHTETFFFYFRAELLVDK